MRIKRKIIFITLCFSWALPAYVFSNLTDALNKHFSNASVIKRKQIYLTKKQLKKAQELAGSHIKIKSRILTRYTPYKGQIKLGFAYIDNHPVRTLNESVLFMLELDGSIKSVQVLQFNEPLEYNASKPWLDQFIKQKLNSKLSLRSDIQGLTGATLTSHAITNAARRILALHQATNK